MKYKLQLLVVGEYTRINLFYHSLNLQKRIHRPDKIEHLPKFVVMGVDYFEFSFFSTSNSFIYKKYFDEEYAALVEKERVDNKKSLESIDFLVNQKLNQYFIYNYYNAIDYLLKCRNGNTSYVSDYGQYIILPQPKAKSGDYLKRDSNVIEIQKRAYLEIIDFCKYHDIELFFLMPPLRSIEMDNYDISVINTFDNMFYEDSNNKYLKFSNNSVFTINDFMDDTHLNIIGADKFSNLVNIALREEIYE